MDLNERFGWLLFGCAIGFVLGYIVRSLHDIKEELDEVDDLVKHDLVTRNEDGYARPPFIMDIALLIVVVLTVFAAFSSQKASNDIQDTQVRLNRLTVCNQQYLGKTIKALNERTTYTLEQSKADIEVKKSQAKFLAVLLKKPPNDEPIREKALAAYFTDLTEFVIVSGKSQNQIQDNPYPTSNELTRCLSQP